MASSMISAALVAQQHLRDDVLVAVSGEAGHALTNATAEAVVAEPGSARTVRVVVDASPPQPSAPADVLMLMCASGDVSTVRSLNDRVWRVLDATPHWQPIVLAVAHVGAAGAHGHHHDAGHSATSSLSDVSGSGASATSFVASLREIEARLERDRRYTGRVDLVLAESVPPSAGEHVVLTLPEALHHCVELVKNPSHVIWDRRAEAFTLTGQRALQRAFWLLDQDMDGALSDAEVLLWYNKMFETATDADVSAVRQHLRDAEAVANGTTGSGDAAVADPASAVQYVTPKGVTVDGFLEACRALLRDGRGAVVWALLWDTGINHDGLPHTPEMLERAPIGDHEQRVQLSVNGARFFGGLYCKQRGDRVHDMWQFTPECPWASLPGLPSPEQGLTAAQFLTCWKALALYEPRAVVEFAAWWGYKGDPALLFVLKPPVDARRSERDWPTTLRVMVAGSTGCGKSALLQRLASPAKTTDGEADDDGHSTVPGGRGPVVRALTVPRPGGDVTLVLEEVAEADARQAAEAPEVMLAYDGVLLCFAPSSDRSVDFMYDVVPALAAHAQLPVAFAITMADVPFSDTPRPVAPDAFLARHGFAWCPFTVTAYPERAQMLGIGNDIDALPATLVEALHDIDATRVPVVTTARKLRRVLIVTVGVAVVGLTLRRLFRRKGE